MPTPAPKPVHEAVQDIMEEIDYIAKSQYNSAQSFTFRGIDDVMNVVAPLLRKHRVGIRQLAIRDVQREWYKTSRGAEMTNVTLTVVWRVTGPDGSEMDAESSGEAADPGDKGVAKAQSVAKRVFLLDLFNIPVAAQTDPDAQAHRRAEPPAQGTAIPPPIAPAKPDRARPQLPATRQWETEAIEIANRGLASLPGKPDIAKAAKLELLDLWELCIKSGESTPRLRSKIQEHGKALAEAIATAEGVNVRPSAGQRREAQITAAVNKVSDSRRRRGQAPPS